MLHLHLSNRAENLFRALACVVATPIRDVFQPEVIVVEENGMARWLSQQLAEQHGVAANIEFPLPAGFVWRLLHGQLQVGAAEAGFSKSTLVWYSMALLPSLKDSPGFEPIHRYLSGAEPETKIYQLSRQIADLFDQYLIYRPDEIRRWEAGEKTHWQSQLWRAMRKISSESHWAGLIEDFKRSLDTQGFNAKGLPERVSLFAISALSPGYIELLSLIAEHIDVHLYVINPSVNYWGDIVSERDLARLRDTWRKAGRSDVSELYTVGNPLLASMGKPCRDFLDQWHAYPSQEHDYFEAPEEASLMSLVQGDVLHLQARGGGELPQHTIPLDESIQVHSCHSPMREVQVLHDRLLKLFNNRPDLKPHEIVVMAPDMGMYAPYIESVFGASLADRFIPYSVASLSLTQQPLVETLLAWLRLPEERFDAPTVIGWLEIPAIQIRFGLDQESVERIRQWVDESGIRWGLDGRHKAELGLPANEHNTWMFGFDRLFLGYAMPSDADLFRGVAPFNNIEGSEALWLGQLREFLAQLARWRKELASPVTLLEWQGRINRFIEQFFLPDEDEALILYNLREQVARVVTSAEAAGFSDVVSSEILHQHLSNLLMSAETPYRLLGGRVTFCNMIPVRSIPFRVVCLLGMNDGEFPRNQRPLGFDLIAQDPRKGDRSLREDDRYVFLESLLSVREVLHISYVGRSHQDNSERLPSVVVTELLDYIEQGYRLEEGELRKTILIEHPLQPFSWRNFTAGSYAAEWLERSAEQPVFSADPLQEIEHESSGNSLTIEGLIRFLVNPSRYFLEHSLGIHCAEYEEALAESEQFELKGLEAYGIKDEMLSELINKKHDGHFERFLARGELPHGGLGKYFFEQTVEGLDSFAEAVKQHLNGKAETIDIDLQVVGLSFTGRLTNVIDGKLVRYRPADRKHKDMLALWIAHLARCASGNPGESLHLGLDATYSLEPLDASEAHAHLEQLVTLYQQGRLTPLPLFLKASPAYVEKFLKVGDARGALIAARGKWKSNDYANGDDQDPWFAQAFRDSDPLDARFEQVSQTVWEPILRPIV
jgi:exodeoxyribonuclease V gamma subunit